MSMSKVELAAISRVPLALDELSAQVGLPLSDIRKLLAAKAFPQSRDVDGQYFNRISVVAWYWGLKNRPAYAARVSAILGYKIPKYEESRPLFAAVDDGTDA